MLLFFVSKSEIRAINKKEAVEKITRKDNEAAIEGSKIVKDADPLYSSKRDGETAKRNENRFNRSFSISLHRKKCHGRVN